MSDREILLIVYGAMKAQDDSDMRDILGMVENHLFDDEKAEPTKVLEGFGGTGKLDIEGFKP